MADDLLATLKSAQVGLKTALSNDINYLAGLKEKHRRVREQLEGSVASSPPVSEIDLNDLNDLLSEIELYEDWIERGVEAIGLLEGEIAARHRAGGWGTFTAKEVVELRVEFCGRHGPLGKNGTPSALDLLEDD